MRCQNKKNSETNAGALETDSDLVNNMGWPSLHYTPDRGKGGSGKYVSRGQKTLQRFNKIGNLGPREIGGGFPSFQMVNQDEESEEGHRKGIKWGNGKKDLVAFESMRERGMITR